MMANHTITLRHRNNTGAFMELTVLIVAIIIAVAGLTIAMAIKPASKQRTAMGVAEAVARQTLAGVQAPDGALSFASDPADIAAVQASAARLRAAYLSEAPTPSSPGLVCVVAAMTIRGPDCSGPVFFVESQIDSTVGCAPIAGRVGNVAVAMTSASICKQLWIGIDNRELNEVVVFPASAKPIQYAGISITPPPPPAIPPIPPALPTGPGKGGPEVEPGETGGVGTGHGDPSSGIGTSVGEPAGGIGKGVSSSFE